MVGIQKKTELPISSCERTLQECDQFKNNDCVIWMEYIKDIITENNWNIVQSPGNGHCLVYSIANPRLLHFFKLPTISFCSFPLWAFYETISSNQVHLKTLFILYQESLQLNFLFPQKIFFMISINCVQILTHKNNMEKNNVTIPIIQIISHMHRKLSLVGGGGWRLKWMLNNKW